MNAVPRGVKNNNPGNIRHSDTKWQGMATDQNDPAFVTFSSPEWGIRAMTKILETYQWDGLTTVAQAIDRWAPPSENDTSAYIDAVCAEANCKPNDPVRFTDIMPQLVKAIIQHENGEQPYTDAQIDQGIAMAS